MTKVSNITSARGTKVANQFIISDEGHGALGNFTLRETFQSYDSVICTRTVWPDITCIDIDETYWNYSRTTSKYRSMFLGESTKETQKKIDSGVYHLINLNK